MQTKLLSTSDIEYIKKGWNGAADTKLKSKQFRYECVIQRVINGEPAEFRAEWVADASNVTGHASDLKLEQMAEARSMRRCLSRAFPVGLSSFEDVQEQKALEYTQDTPLANASQDERSDLEIKIASAQNIAELEQLKPEITKSKSNDMVKAYAARQKELQNAPKAEVGPDYLKQAKEKIEKGTEMSPEEIDIEDRERADKQAVLDDEANRIKELKEELEEEV